jgi:hypothetical protein
MQEPLHFYYPPQEQSRVQQLPDSSLRRQRSHLSIAPPQPSPVHQYSQGHLRNTQQQQQQQHRTHQQQQQQQLHAEMVAAVAAARRNSEEAEYLQHYGATYPHHRQYYLSDQEQPEVVAVQSSPIHQHFQPRQQFHLAHVLQQPPLSPHDPRYLEIQQARFLVESMGTTATMIKFDSPVHHTPPLLLD